MTVISHSGSRIEILFSEEKINTRISELSGEISSAGLDDFLIIAILSGSFIFASDLIRSFYHHGLSPEVDFITLASYHGGTRSSGTIDVISDISRSVEGRNILLVDDILESGRTLSFAADLMTQRGAASVSTCVLLDKKIKRPIPMSPDFRAFDCPDVFVVGYGMDFDHRLRELPFIGRIMQ